VCSSAPEDESLADTGVVRWRRASLAAGALDLEPTGSAGGVHADGLSQSRLPYLISDWKPCSVSCLVTGEATSVVDSLSESRICNACKFICVAGRHSGDAARSHVRIRHRCLICSSDCSLVSVCLMKQCAAGQYGRLASAAVRYAIYDALFDKG